MIFNARSLTTAEVREQLADVINRAAYAKERLVLTRHGKELAAVVPVEDLRLLQDLEDLFDLHEAREALSEAEDGGTVSWDDFKKAVGL